MVQPLIRKKGILQKILVVMQKVYTKNEAHVKFETGHKQALKQLKD
jgi:hypothetical protein